MVYVTQSNPVNTNTEGAIESVRVKWVIIFKSVSMREPGRR